jgi:hypothetical protein
MEKRRAKMYFMIQRLTVGAKGCLGGKIKALSGF